MTVWRVAVQGLRAGLKQVEREGHFGGRGQGQQSCRRNWERQLGGGKCVSHFLSLS